MHIFNLHLGTSFFERRQQARQLFRQQILNGDHLPGNKIVLGDFNEWTSGLASRLLRCHFRGADIHTRPSRAQTYPGFFPLLKLDQIYFDRSLKLTDVRLHRSRTALLASDHLPLVAEFSVPVAAGQSYEAQRRPRAGQLPMQPTPAIPAPLSAD